MKTIHRNGDKSIAAEGCPVHVQAGFKNIGNLVDGRLQGVALRDN